MKKKNIFLFLLPLLLISCNGGNETSSFESLDKASEEVSLSEAIGSSEVTSSSQEGGFSEEPASSSKTDVKDEILSLANLGISNSSKVSGGTFVYDNLTSKTYEFGVDNYGNFLHVEEKVGSSTVEEYYGYDADSDIYGIQVNYNIPRAVSNTLTGNEIDGPCVDPYATSDEDKMFGATGVVSYLYNLALLDSNWDFTDLSKGEIYSFSVGKVISGLQPILWLNTVSFKLQDDAFSYVEAKFEKYVDIIADYEFNNIYYISDNAQVKETHSVVFTQKLGARNAENPFDIETYYFSSFDLSDSNNIVTESLYMDAGTAKELTLTSVEPSTASAQVDKIKVIESTGNVTGSYSNVSKKLSLNCKNPGEYEVEISSKRVSKTIHLSVDEPAPTSISILYYFDVGDEYSANILTEYEDTINSYINSEILLRPSFTPYTASQGFTLEVISDNKENLSYEKETIKTSAWVDNSIEVYRFVAEEVGTYVVKITSIKDSSIYKEFKLVCASEPSVNELIKERYVRSSDGVIYVDAIFEKDEVDASTGIVSINDMFIDASNNGSYKYKYNQDTRKFTLTKLNEAGEETTDKVNLSLEYNSNYDLVYSNGTSTSILNEFSYNLMIIHTEWMARDSSGGFVILEFDLESTGTFGYSKTDQNFKPIKSFNTITSYSIVEEGEDIIIRYNALSITRIEKSGFIKNITDIVLDPSYSFLTTTMTISDVEETLTFTRGG